MISGQRQWLADNKIERRDPNGNGASVDWSKASSQEVTAAYGYVHALMAAANRNHTLSLLGIAAAVTFGHGARHLAGTGLNQGDVEAAIQRDIQEGVKNATQPTGSFWGQVKVGGQTIEYRAYTLPSGTINVGTYYIP